MASLINIYNFKFETLIELVSTNVSLVILVILPAGLVTSYFLIRKYRGLQLLEDEKFQKGNMSELLSSDHKTNLIGTYWKVLVAFRWTLTLLILVLGRDHFELQILTLLALSVLF